MSKKILTLAIVGMFLLSFTSAIVVDFYYADSCPHCQQIKPYIAEMVKIFPDKEINYHDIMKEDNPSITSIPLIKIRTCDNRIINLIGGYEIEKYMYCELQEMSTKQCPTTGELKRGSFFINE